MLPVRPAIFHESPVSTRTAVLASFHAETKRTDGLEFIHTGRAKVALPLWVPETQSIPVLVLINSRIIFPQEQL